MQEVFINQEGCPYVLDADGSIDLSLLELKPATIVINRSEGKSG